MLAFRPFDTNGAAQQSYLGLSPPSKKPISCENGDGDMLYKPSSQDSGFKFDVRSVAITSDQKATVSKTANNTKAGW